MLDKFPISITLLGCARCGEAHKDLQALPFTKNSIGSEGSEYEYWAMCPILNEPILVRVTKWNTK